VFDDVPDTCLNNVSRNDLVDVKSYHLDTTGTKTETAILQKALDDVARTHKVLLFSNGIYKSGTLKVHSNSRIHFLDGALLKASGIKDDFPTDQGSKESDHINDKANFTDNGEKMTHSRLLLIDKAENVTITGRGTIDGDGGVLRAQGRPSNLIRIRQSKNVRLEGLVLRNPAAWNTHILYSENVVMRDIKIINDRNVANTDGIDPDASKNVLIENCFAYCGDDNIAIKSTNNGGLLQNTEDITVRGCVFLTKKSSLKVGTETKAPMMKNILFEDNDVIESDRGMALYCEDGAQLEHIRFINNRFEKNYPDGGQKEIHFAISRRSNAGSAGRINDILIKDCSFAYPFSRSSMIEGLDAEHKISQLVIDNLCIAGKKRMSLDEAEMTTNAFVDDIIFK
jgi:polygalacturonase